jgi:hypothetical protein
VERSAWTDERLDDMAERTQDQFGLLRGDLKDVRAELKDTHAEFRAEMREFRAEMQTMRAEMQAGFTSIRRDMFHGAVALFGTLAAMIAAMVVHTLN